MLVAEAQYTGDFKWSFYRDYSRNSDAIIFPSGGLIIFGCLFYYFYKHPAMKRQTLGEYVLGFKIVAVGGNETPSYGWRVIWAFIGMCVWPISVILALSNNSKAFWWDGLTGTKAIRVTAINKSLRLTP